MRRLAPALLATTAALLVAGPAQAAFHLEKVSELALSMGGNPAAQFVELKSDSPTGESFPDDLGPYKLVVFDGSGNPAGEQTLDDGKLRGTAAPVLLASVAAGISGADPLTVTLPQGSGQVCFTQGSGNAKVHCLAYGCPASPFPVAQSARAPADGESLQRVASGLALGAPTPNAANAATGAADCAAGGGAEDTTAPSEKLSGKRRQDVDKLAVGIVLDEAGSVTVGGTVSVPGASKVFRFKSVTRSVQANVRTTVKLRLSKKGKRAVKGALGKGRRIKAKLTVAARDAAGNRSTAKRTVTLTD